MTIQEAKQKHELSLMQLPGVVGVGIGKHKDQPVIVVMVDKLSRKLEKHVPDQLEGFDVNIRQTGEIRAF